MENFEDLRTQADKNIKSGRDLLEEVLKDITDFPEKYKTTLDTPGVKEAFVQLLDVNLSQIGFSIQEQSKMVSLLDIMTTSYYLGRFVKEKEMKEQSELDNLDKLWDSD